MVGVTTNTELNKIQGEVRYFEPLDAKHSFSYPTVGNMPKKEEEAAMSTIVLDALGVRHEIGEETDVGYTDPRSCADKNIYIVRILGRRFCLPRAGDPGIQGMGGKGGAYRDNTFL